MKVIAHTHTRKKKHISSLLQAIYHMISLKGQKLPLAHLP